jgi:hypothetical protein
MTIDHWQEIQHARSFFTKTTVYRRTSHPLVNLRMLVSTNLVNLSDGAFLDGVQYLEISDWELLKDVNRKAFA